MAIKWGSNTDNVKKIVFKTLDGEGELVDKDVKEVVFGSDIVWEKPYTLKIEEIHAEYINNATVSREETFEPTASSGDLSNDDTIYNKDVLYAKGLAKSDTTTYTAWSPSSISTPSLYLVDDTIIEVANSKAFSVECNYSTSSDFSSFNTISIANKGTQQLNLAAGTTYYFRFKTTQTRTRTDYTYGLSISYDPDPPRHPDNPEHVIVENNLKITYTGSCSTSTTTESQELISSTASLTTNEAYTISFTGPNYGYWQEASKTAYAGDEISTSGTIVTCYKNNAPSTVRWTNAVAAWASTVQYTYTTPIISNGNFIVTGDATISASNSRSIRSYTLKSVIVNGDYFSDWGVNVGGTDWNNPANGATKSVAYGTALNGAGGMPNPSKTVYDFNELTAPTVTPAELTSVEIYNPHAVTTYLQYKVSGSSSWTTYSSIIPEGSSFVTDLAPATDYDFRFYAIAPGAIYNYSITASITDTSTGAAVTSMNEHGATVTFTGGCTTTATSKTVYSESVSCATSNKCTITLVAKTNQSGFPTGSWSPTSFIATYGSNITIQANSLVMGGSTVATYTPGTSSGYSSSYSITGSGIVQGDKTITGTTNYQCTVTFAKGTGITSMWSSTNPAATSGNPTGTAYDIGSVVYLYAKTDGKHVPDLETWTLSSGSCDAGSTSAVFRYSPHTCDKNWNFGTLNTTAILSDITITCTNIADNEVTLKYYDYAGTQHSGVYSSGFKFRTRSTYSYYISATAKTDCKFLVYNSGGTLTLNSYIDETVGSTITNKQYDATTSDTTTEIKAYTTGTAKFNRIISTSFSTWNSALDIKAPLSSEIDNQTYVLQLSDSRLIPEISGLVYNQQFAYDSTGNIVYSYPSISLKGETLITNSDQNYPYIMYQYTNESGTGYTISLETAVDGDYIGDAGHWIELASGYGATVTQFKLLDMPGYSGTDAHPKIHLEGLVLYSQYAYSAPTSCVEYIPGTDSTGACSSEGSLSLTEDVTVEEDMTVTGKTTYSWNVSTVTIRPNATTLSSAYFTYMPVAASTSTTKTLTVGSDNIISNVSYRAASFRLYSKTGYGWQDTSATNFANSVTNTTTYNVTIDSASKNFAPSAPTPPCTVTITCLCYSGSSLIKTTTKTYSAYPGSYTTYRPAADAPVISGYQYSSVASGTSGYTVQSSGYLSTVVINNNQNLPLTMKYYYTETAPSD